MKEQPSEPDQNPDAETAEIMKIIAEYRAKEAAGLFEYAKHNYKEVHSWREAWIFIFYVAHLAHGDYLRSENGKVKCVVWPVQEFNDKLVNVLEKIADRIGPDNDLIEMRLIETKVTSAGIERLKTFLPNAKINLFSQEQAKKDKRIKRVNTDIEWIGKLYL